MSDETGLHQPPKVLRLLADGEQLDDACNGHEIRASWDPRMVHQQTVLVTDRRLLLVGKPSRFHGGGTGADPQQLVDAAGQRLPVTLTPPTKDSSLAAAPTS